MSPNIALSFLPPAARTGEVIGEFSRLYEQQYAVALFNKVRFDIEGGGGPQPQLLHRKVIHFLLHSSCPLLCFCPDKVTE